MGLDETKSVDPDLSNAAFNNGNLGSLNQKNAQTHD